MVYSYTCAAIAEPHHVIINSVSANSTPRIAAAPTNQLSNTLTSPSINDAKKRTKSKKNKTGGRNLQDDSRREETSNKPFLESDRGFVSCVRRLAASSSQLGQLLLSTAFEKKKNNNENREAEKASFLALTTSSSFVFKCSYSLFTQISDSINAATVSCNIASTLRCQANHTSSHCSSQLSKFAFHLEKKDFRASTLLKGKTPLPDHLAAAFELLEESLQALNVSQSLLRTSKPSKITALINANLKSEEAQTLLSMGIYSSFVHFLRSRLFYHLDNILRNHP